jgi:predicted HicB family RNase H-like nuclease
LLIIYWEEGNVYTNQAQSDKRGATIMEQTIDRKLSAQPRLATLHVKVTPQDKDALYEMAAKKDISVAQLVRTMIRAMTKGAK